MNRLPAPLHPSTGGAESGTGRLAALGVVAVLLTAIVVNQSAVHWRDNLADDHLFAYYGWCVSIGARPFVDVWDNKPPLIWWLNAAAMQIGGNGVQSAVALGSIVLGVALAAFLLAAREIFHPSLTLLAAATAAVLLSHLRFECGGNRTESLVIACELVVVSSYLCWKRTGRSAWLAAAGLAAGAAPLCKQAGVAAAAACIADLVLMQVKLRRRGERAAARAALVRFGVWFGGAALTVPLVAGAALAAQGALGATWFAVVEFNQAYFAVGDASWTALPRALRVMAPGLWPLAGPSCVVAAGVGYAALRRAPGRGVPPANTDGSRSIAARSEAVLLLFVWLALAVYLATVGPGRREYHLAPALPPLALLMLWPMDRLIGAGGLAAKLAARPSVGVALLVYLAVLTGTAQDHAAIVRQCWERKSRWNSLAWRAPPGYEQQAARIRVLTRPDERIYVWGWSPGTYRFAYRRAASRFATIEKLAHVREHAAFIRAAVLGDLRREPPALFAMLPGDLAAVRGGHDPELGEWLLGRYEEVETVGGMTLMLRRP